MKQVPTQRSPLNLTVKCRKQGALVTGLNFVGSVVLTSFACSIWKRIRGSLKWLNSTLHQFQMVDEPKVDRDPAVNRSYSRGRCGRLPHFNRSVAHDQQSGFFIRCGQLGQRQPDLPILIISMEGCAKQPRWIYTPFALDLSLEPERYRHLLPIYKTESA